MSRVFSPVFAPFALLFVGALYSTWYLVLNNHTIDLMSYIQDIGPRLLPHTNATLKTSYTGISAVDYELTGLTRFFWEIVDGSLPPASLQAFHFSGQFLAAVCLLMIEGYRRGNRGRLVSFVWVWGLAMQKYSFAVIMPIYSITHLCTITTNSNVDLTLDFFDIAAVATIPVSTTIGFIVPAALLATPTPATISFGMKQNIIALWQVFPVTVEVLQRLISPISAKLIQRSYNLSPSASETAVRAATLTTLRRVYTFILVICAITHIQTMIILAISHFSPSAFAFEYTFSSAFIPSTMSAATKMASVGQGAHLFLQYDEIIASITILSWAMLLSKTPGPDVRDRKGFPGMVAVLILGTAFLGPVGCAAVFLWMRDERILTRSAEGGQKTK